MDNTDKKTHPQSAEPCNVLQPMTDLSAAVLAEGHLLSS